MGNNKKDVFDEQVEVISNFDKLKSSITKLLVGLSFLDFAILTGVYAYIDYTGYQYAVFFNGGVALLLLLIGLLILPKKDQIAAILLNLIIGPALFANVWIYLGKEIGIHYVLIMLAIVPFFTIGRKYILFQWLFGVANIVMITILINFEPINSMIGSVSTTLINAINYSVIGLSLLFVCVVFVLYNQLIENYEVLAKKKSDEIETTLEEIRLRGLEDFTNGAVSNRKMEELILAEIARSNRYETSFSLIIFSFSDIKEIFAVYGQEKGEKIMEHLVQIVRTDLRLVDVLGRWSDREFVVFMPEIKLYQAVYVAQRLLSMIVSTEFLPKINLPANFAVLQRLPGENFDTLSHRLSELMRNSIAEGENRICN